MRQILKSYWFWFYVTVAIISTIDFVDHVTRTDSYFSDIWLNWLLFTIASTISLCLTIYFTNILTRNLFKKDNLIFQSISIILGLLTHVYLSGPIFDRLIFGQVTLDFFPTSTIFIAGLGIFYVVRLLTYIMTKNLN